MSKISEKPSLSERLLSSVMFEANSGCWLWDKAVNRAGYGTLKVGEKTALAHRVSYEQFVGPIPDGLFACHKCDTPACIRPDHLFLGTNTDNLRDMHRKGRASSQKRENNGNAKLTPEQVSEIRTSTLSLKAMSEKYGVAIVTTCRVRRGKSWAE